MKFKGLRFAAAEIWHASAGTVMKVVMVAISVIPLLYGGLYLTAFLDPYENLDTVPVAVVNADAGAEVNGEWRVVGDDVAQKLADNHDGLGWEFVSAEEAQRGLENGTYYMTCTIPENFTATIASADSDAPEKAALDIEYNETQNMLASQIGATVWKEVRTQVSDSIAEEYWNNVFDRVNEGGVQIGTAADGAQELADGMADARKGSETITDNLGSLADGAGALDNGLGTLSEGASSLNTGLGALDQGAGALSDGATTLADGASGLDAGLGKLDEGASTLADGTKDLSDGAGTLADGTKDLSDGAKSLKKGLGTLSDGASTLSSGTQTLADGASQLASGTESLSDGANTLSSGAATLKNDGTQALADGTSQLAQKTAGLPDSATVEQAEAGAQQISAGFGNLRGALAALASDESGLPRAAAGSTELATGLSAATKSGGAVSQLADGSNSVADGASGAKQASDATVQAIAGIDTEGMTKSQKNAIEAALKAAKTTQGAVSKVEGGARDVANGMSGLNAQLAATAGQASQLAEGLNAAAAAVGSLDDTSPTTLYGGVNSLAAGYESFSSQVFPLVQGAPELKEAIAKINAGASEVNDKMGTLVAGADSLATGASTVKAGASSVAAGAGEVNTGASSLATGAASASSGANDLAAGAKKVNAGAGDLAKGADKVKSGAATLSKGMDTASSGASELADGAGEIDDGAAALADGAKTAHEGAGALADGAATAKDGSAKIADGAGQLRDGSQELTEGLATAEDGADELAEGLADGASELHVEGAETKAEVMSAPVQLNEDYFTTVKNYGTGFAPYFISLGLWVGALMAGFVLRPLNRRLVLSGGNPAMVAFSSFMPLALMSVVQALLLLVTLQFGLQLQIDNVPGYYAFGILTALAFAAFMQFLMAAFGFPGKFIAIILLMLQLTSAAGTFPIEQTPAFFQMMNPFMPMTYVVAGMRQVMTGVNYGTVALCVAVLAGIGIVSFALTALVARAKRTVRMEDLHPILQLG